MPRRSKRRVRHTENISSRGLTRPERFIRAEPLARAKLPVKTQRYITKALKTINLRKVDFRQELNAIKQRRVKPQFSRLSAVASCKKKKAKARHDYFSMRAAGKGAFRKNRKTNRFTVRC